jgi:RNA polymerase sigma-70 factor (ECF subfamily)
MTALALDAHFPFAKPSRRQPDHSMDEAKFESLYRRIASSVWSYLFRLTGDAAAADDLLQKAFFRVLRTNPAVESDDHLRRYVFKVATNLAFDHFRETKREREYASAAPRGAVRPEAMELRHDMMRVFAELKPQERALLWLAHVEESNHDEIGDALGLKSKSVRVLLFRARKRLGELLAKKGLAPSKSAIAEVTR